MHRPIGGVALALVCLAVIGCQSATNQIADAPPAPLAPDALIEQITSGVSSAKTTSDALASNHQAFRVEILAKRTEETCRLIDQLLAHADADEAQRMVGRELRSAILFEAAKHCGDEYAVQLSDLAQELLSEKSDSNACRLALARWLDFQYVQNEAPFEEARHMVGEYGRAYASDEETAELFAGLSRRLVKAGQLEQAKDILDDAQELLEDQKTLSVAWAHYARGVKRYRNRAAKQYAAARLRAKVRAAAKGREVGYFVMFSMHPKTKHCNYDVVHNLDGAVEYVEEALVKQWTWEVSATFPDSPEGKKEARLKKSSLLRNNTRMSFGG